MRKYVQLFIVAVFIFSYGSRLQAQNLDFTIRFNNSTSQYEVYGMPDFDDSFFFVGGGSQISLVLPELVNNVPIAIQTVSGGLWIDNSQIYSPTADPIHDFHGIASNGSVIGFVNGQEKLLFTFSLPGGICVPGVRLFENASDPQSTDTGMGGGDFNNYFANVFNFIDYYNSNYNNIGTICLEPPVVTPTTIIVIQDSTINVCMPVFDVNTGDTFTTSLCIPGPSNGTAVAIISGNQVCLDYTPFLGFTGSDAVCLTVCDQTGLCTTDTIPVIVLPENCTGNNPTNDIDDDGICDDIDNCVGIANPDQADCDNDGIGDVCELDSDGDSIPDDCDLCLVNDSTGDTDGDGVCDDIDNCVVIPNPDQADCDNDGEGDVCEPDGDNDAVPDACDICVGDDASGDTDGDGICDDIDNCIVMENPDQADCDNDGEGDVCEPDEDNDAVPDACDICVGDDASGDTDSDGICDDIDNCIVILNPDQADCDNDGEGNVCEGDGDNDGVPDGCDICVGDDASGDTDGDGICDDIDNCVVIPNPAQADCDNDGEGDACEADSDGDTVPDDCDICVGNDALGDDDNDGICNEIANCDTYSVSVSNDGTECVQPFTDVYLYATVIGDNINLDYFTFSWSGENNFSSSMQNPILPNIENDDSGTYTVTITNTLSNCQDILSTVVDITIIPNEPQITASAEMVCIGNEFTLSIPEYSGTDVHYEWIGPNGSTSSGAYSDEAELSISNFEASDEGAYQVIVTVDQCSSLFSEALSIQIQAPLPPPQITGIAQVCEGTVLSLQTSTVADEYTWTGPNGFSSDLANPSITISAGLQHAGDYNLMVLTNGCISPVSTIEVNIVEAPGIPILELQTDICMGEDIVLSIVNPDAATYQWIAPSASANSSFGTLGDPNNVVWTGEPNTTISMTANPAFYEAGMWQVQALNVYGCVSEASNPLALNINNTPAAAIASNEGDVCESFPVYLHASQVPNATYQWFDGDPGGAPAGTLVSTEKDPILYNVTPGLHQYFVKTEYNGCSANEFGHTEVLVKENPIIQSVSNTGPFCLGTSIQLESSDIPGATYYWYGPNGFTSNTQNPTIPNASPETVGTYLLFVEVNGCPSSPSTTDVLVNEEVTIPIAINNGPLCDGGDLLFNVSNPDPLATYEWFDSLGNVSIGTGAELFFEEVGTEMTGTYYVVATMNNCPSDPSQTTNTGEDAFSEVLIELPDLEAAYVGDPLYTCENSITINALATTSGTGQWTLINGGPSTTILQPGQASTMVIDLQEGLNELTWTVSSNSCGITSSDTLMIEWSDNPPVAADDLFEIAYNETLDNINVFNNDIPNTEAFDISIITEVENGSIVLLEDNLMAYWPDDGFIGTETFVYRICHSYCPDLCDEGIVTIRVATDMDCEAASVMTPNRDGFNDTFIITCVIDHPGSSLSVFNRWGDEVYFSSDYRNEWEGTYKNEALPSGVYFYQLELNDSEGTKMSGSIFLER